MVDLTGEGGRIGSASFFKWVSRASMWSRLVSVRHPWVCLAWIKLRILVEMRMSSASSGTIPQSPQSVLIRPAARR